MPDTATDTIVQDPVLTVPDGTDPVLASLQLAESQYLEFRGQCDQQAMELKEIRLQAERLREVHDQLTLEVQQAQAAVRAERKRAERHKERAKHFAEGLKAIHKALFHGNVYDLILRTCLAVTGATRGVYLTPHGDRFRARAAIAGDGSPQAPPSPFIDALCRKVTETRDTLVVNREEDMPAVPPSDRPGERFRNCVAAPVAILKKF